MTLVLRSDWLNDPQLPELVDAGTKRLADEKRKRAKFYRDITPSVKAEFINGEVIMHSPALHRHNATRGKLVLLMQSWVTTHDLGIVADEKALCAFPRNDYEPDVVFFGLEKSRKIKPDTMKYSVPDFVCEVLSSSTAKRDRGIKFKDYEAHGVSEFWIVDADKEVVEQYVKTKAGRFELRLKSGKGEIESEVVSGFQIPVRALFDGKLNLTVLKRLIA